MEHNPHHIAGRHPAAACDGRSSCSPGRALPAGGGTGGRTEPAAGLSLTGLSLTGVPQAPRLRRAGWVGAPWCAAGPLWTPRAGLRTLGLAGSARCLVLGAWGLVRYTR